MKKNIQLCFGSLLLVLGSFFTACGPDASLDMVGMFAGTSPTIDERFEQSKEYNDKYGYATLQALSDDYHVYVCTDTHITKTRTRWEHFIRTYRMDMLCPVAVHLGDIIDARTDYEFVNEALERHPLSAILPIKPDTLMAVCGNHDIYFKQWNKFINTFKTCNYYFIVKTPTGKHHDVRALPCAGCLARRHLPARRFRLRPQSLRRYARQSQYIPQPCSERH